MSGSDKIPLAFLARELALLTDQRPPSWLEKRAEKPRLRRLPRFPESAYRFAKRSTPSAHSTQSNCPPLEWFCGSCEMGDNRER
jgi:hypothetical protein